MDDHAATKSQLGLHRKMSDGRPICSSCKRYYDRLVTYDTPLYIVTPSCRHAWTRPRLRPPATLSSSTAPSSCRLTTQAARRSSPRWCGAASGCLSPLLTLLRLACLAAAQASDRLRAQAVEFWGWVLRDASVQTSLAHASGLRMLYATSKEYQLQIDEALKVVKVDGEPVLHTPPDGTLAAVAAGTGAALLALAAVAGAMGWRNLKLRRKVQQLTEEDNDLEWTADADSPIVKVAKLLQVVYYYYCCL